MSSRTPTVDPCAGRRDRITLSRVVLDMNVFVAAGFNRDSGSVRLIQALRRGELTPVWDAVTRRESRRVAEQIPLLFWKASAKLFEEQGRYPGSLALAEVDYVPDPADRKSAAPAAATGAALISHGEELLANRAQADIIVATPTEFFERGDGR